MTEVNTNEDFINTLNDDGLNEIFKKLPILDRVRIERVCTRWKSVTEQNWSDIKSMVIYKHSRSHKDNWKVKISKRAHWKSARDYRVRRRNVKKFLVLWGRFLNQLDIYSSHHFDERHLSSEFIAKHCYNLTTLNINDEIFLPSEVKELFSKCPLLENVSINVTGISNVYFPKFIPTCLQGLLRDRVKILAFSTDLDDDPCRPVTLSLSTPETLLDFVKLHTVKFKNMIFELKTLKIIAEIQGLQCIEFKGCLFQDSIFAITHFRNLEHLTLIDVDQLCNDLLSQLATNCSKLKYLSIGVTYGNREHGENFMTELIKFKNLEELWLHYLNETTGDMSKLTRLKVFQAISCDGIDDDTVISLLENAENLTYLNVTWANVTGKILDVARRVTSQRTNGLELNVFINSNKRSGSEKTKIYKEFPLLKINQGYPNSDWRRRNPEESNSEPGGYSSTEIPYSDDELGLSDNS